MSKGKTTYMATIHPSSVFDVVKRCGCTISRGEAVEVTAAQAEALKVLVDNHGTLLVAVSKKTKSVEGAK